MCLQSRLLVGWMREERVRDTGCLVLLAGAVGGLPVGNAGRKCHRPRGALWPRGSAGGGCEQLTGCVVCRAVPCPAWWGLGTPLGVPWVCQEGRGGSPKVGGWAGSPPSGAQPSPGDPGHPWVTLAHTWLQHQQCPQSPALSGVPGGGGSRVRDTPMETPAETNPARVVYTSWMSRCFFPTTSRV